MKEYYRLMVGKTYTRRILNITFHHYFTSLVESEQAEDCYFIDRLTMISDNNDIEIEENQFNCDIFMRLLLKGKYTLIQ